jgi:hypothetical protein
LVRSFISFIVLMMPKQMISTNIIMYSAAASCSIFSNGDTHVNIPHVLTTPTPAHRQYIASSVGM